MLSIYVEYVGAEEGVEGVEGVEKFVELDGLAGKLEELEELKEEADCWETTGEIFGRSGIDDCGFAGDGD